MVLIISEEIDQPTSKVIEWIESFGVKWIRINFVDFFRVNKSTVSFDSNNVFEFYFKNERIKLDSITGVWFRRTPKFKLFEDFIVNKANAETEVLELANKIWDFIAAEDLEFFNYFLYKLSCHPNIIGHPFINNLNKLEQLEQANKLGIKIPNTIVTSNKIDLKQFVWNRDCIIKPVRNIVTINCNENRYTSFTKELFTDDLNDYKVIFPSIVQNKIDKLFELRVFFLKGQIYPMLIHDSKVSSDYRINQYSSSINFSIIKIDISLEKKINELASYFQLNCCSIDFIYGKDSEYYFLEINPVGQFGFLSTPCNYNLEKIIAKQLCQL
jgi:hypothetical protein